MKLWLLGYVVLVGVIVAAMVVARARVTERLATSESIDDWQQWREDVRREQPAFGAPARAVPKSEEPPALVLMRDHFGVLVAGAILFSSALYWVTAWFTMGILGDTR